MQQFNMQQFNKLNILNIVFYVLNVLITFGIGTAGWFGIPTNVELSDKYQTIVQPNPAAFSIWGLIFTAQGIFAVAQLFPKFREDKMVLEGVKYWYILVCIFQCLWTIAFGFEVIWLSLIFILAILGSLVALLYSQYYTESNGSLVEFWLLRFPFAIHCGWLTAASALNVNLVFVDSDSPADVQLACGIISLAVLHAVSVWVIYGFQKPNYTIAGVLAWANYFINVELSEPRDQIAARFSADAISGVRYAAATVFVIILLQIAVRLPFDVKARKFNKEEESSDSVTKDEEAADEEATDEVGEA